MKVFICSYSGFSLAVPMDNVSSIMLLTEDFTKSADYKNKIYLDEENCNTYISLPFLFNCPSVNTKHGIILKYPGEKNDVIMKNKTILLSTEIECESEIPDNNIFPIPKSFGTLNFSLFFKGILFSSMLHESAGNLILLLNPELIVQNIKKEKTND